MKSLHREERAVITLRPVRAFSPSGLEEGLELGLPRSSVGSMNREVDCLEGRKSKSCLLWVFRPHGGVALTQGGNKSRIHIKLSVLKKRGYLARRARTAQGVTALIRKDAVSFLELLSQIR